MAVDFLRIRGVFREPDAPGSLAPGHLGKPRTSLGAVSCVRYDSPIHPSTPDVEPVEMLVAIEYCVV